jgi:excisionase family DNA binding protein
MAETKVQVEPATMSVDEAAARLGIGRSLAYELARTGELPGVLRLGRKRFVVSRSQLERTLDGEPVGSAPVIDTEAA